MEILLLGNYAAGSHRYGKEHPFAQLTPTPDRFTSTSQFSLASALDDTAPLPDEPDLFQQHRNAQNPAVRGASFDEELNSVGPTLMTTRAGITGQAFTPDSWGDDIVTVLQTRFFLHDLHPSLDPSTPTVSPSHATDNPLKTPSKTTTNNSANTSQHQSHVPQWLNSENGAPHGTHSALVAVYPTRMRLFFDDGRSFVLRLKKTVSAAWPLRVGILLQHLERDPFSDGGKQVFYNVRHPTEDMAPVAFRKPGQQTKDTTEKERTPDQMVFDAPNTETYLNETVITVTHDSIRMPLMVTFDKGSRKHSVWTYEVQESSTDPSLFGKKSAKSGESDVTRLLNFEYNDHKMAMVFRFLWEETNEIRLNEPAESVFLAHTSTGEEVICFFGGRDEKTFGTGQLVALRIPNDPALESFIPVLQIDEIEAAVPLSATRNQMLDILLLHSDNFLSLWTGYGREVCSVGYPGRDRHLQVVGLDACAGNRVNLRGADRRIVRGILSFTPKCQLTSQCLQALAFILPEREAASFLKQFRELNFGRAGRDAEGINREWDHFVATLRLAGYQPSSSRKGKGVSREEFADDFDWLQQVGIRSTRVHQSLLAAGRDQRPSDGLKRKRGSTHGTSSSDVQLQMYLPQLLLGFHLVYEDIKLDRTLQPSGKLLAQLLVEMASTLGYYDYAQYYMSCGLHQAESGHGKCDWQSLETGNRVIDVLPGYQTTEKPSSSLSATFPPNVCAALHEMIMTRKSPEFLRQFQNGGLYERFPSCPRLSRLISVYQHYNAGPERMVLEMAQLQFTLFELDNLPIGVAFPLKCALDACRSSPPKGWPSAAYALIGRDDLANQLSPVRAPLVPEREVLEQKDDASMGVAALWESIKEVEKEKRDETGTDVPLDEIIQLRFPADRRLLEAQRLLQSARPIALKTVIDEGENGEDKESRQQEELIKLAARTLALPVARALLTFATAMPSQTGYFPMPKLEVSATFKTAPTAKVKLDPTKSKIPPDLLDWPGFHDGVAWALRIPPSAAEFDGSWIGFQGGYGPDPKDPSANLPTRHAGFLLGLGLTGHLKNLNRDRHMEYLHQQLPFVSMGYMLGLGATRFATGDLEASRLVYVHLPKLEAGEDPSMVRSACAVSLALLHIQSNGSQFHVQRLLEEMRGMERVNLDGPNRLRETYATSCGLAIGLMMLGRAHQVRKPAESTWDLAKAMLHLTTSVNADITEVGATVAIGLGYFKSNNAEIANTLVIPKNQSQLDQTRPHVLQLRVLARNLIMWDSIQPTKEWIRKQIPRYLFDIGRKDDVNARSVEYDPSSGMEATWSIIAGACFSIGLKFAGTGDVGIRDLLLKHLDVFIDVGASKSIDFEYPALMKKALARNCMDAVIIAVSLVMVGTGDLDVFRQVRRLHGREDGMPIKDFNYGNHMAAHMALGFLFLGGGRYTISQTDRAVGLLVCALLPPFPQHPTQNMGVLQALRHLWVLAVEPRVLVTQDAHTGHVMSLPIVVRFGADGGDPVTMTTPCMLPPLWIVHSISSDSERCWPIELEVHGNQALQEKLQKTGVMLVQARKSMLQTEAKWNEILQFSSASGLTNPASVPMVEDATSLISWKRYVRNSSDASHGSNAWTNIIKECVAHEKRSLFQTHLWLHNLLANFAERVTVDAIWNLKLVFACCGVEKGGGGNVSGVSSGSGSSMMDVSLLWTVQKKVVVEFAKWEGSGSVLPGGGSLERALEVFVVGGRVEEEVRGRDYEIVAAYMLWHQWPAEGMLRSLVGDVRRMKEQGMGGKEVMIRVMKGMKGTPFATMQKVLLCMQKL
ncbi:Anaphase-promoting complex subunit 1 [Rhizophlyctis rosea]|nr:Anaphase-promoting complex subunit 1 [Rhizophlyctis rosea]